METEYTLSCLYSEAFSAQITFQDSEDFDLMSVSLCKQALQTKMVQLNLDENGLVFIQINETILCFSSIKTDQMVRGQKQVKCTIN